MKAKRLRIRGSFALFGRASAEGIVYAISSEIYSRGWSESAHYYSRSLEAALRKLDEMAEMEEELEVEAADLAESSAVTAPLRLLASVTPRDLFLLWAGAALALVVEAILRIL